MGKRYDKSLTYDERILYVIKGYEMAIIQNYALGLSVEMKLVLTEFVQSKEMKDLFYKTARMIYYRQSLLRIRWTVRKHLQKLLKETCLQGVISPICEHMIFEATAKVIRGGHNLTFIYAHMDSNRTKNIASSVKLCVKFLEFLQETLSRVANVKFFNKPLHFWAHLIKKLFRRKR